MPSPELIIILLAVAGLWALFLLPSLFERRKEAPLTSTRHYGNVSSRLGQMQADQASYISASSQRMSGKRRRTLLIASVFALGTLTMAITSSSLVWLVGHLVVDAFLAWYVAMLVQIRQQEQAISQGRYSAIQSEPDRRVRVIAS